MKSGSFPNLFVISSMIVGTLVVIGCFEFSSYAPINVNPVGGGGGVRARGGDLTNFKIF